MWEDASVFTASRSSFRSDPEKQICPSKYESGQISVDIETLYVIATVLGVEVSQFVDCPIPAPERLAATPASPFGGTLYLYYYDGRTKRIVRTVLELQLQQAEQNNVPCRCYMDVPSFEEKEQ